jgi:hypothetical protein
MTNDSKTEAPREHKWGERFNNWLEHKSLKQRFKETMENHSKILANFDSAFVDFAYVYGIVLYASGLINNDNMTAMTGAAMTSMATASYYDFFRKDNPINLD